MPSNSMPPSDPSTPAWLRWASDIARATGLTTSIIAAVAMVVALVVVVVLLPS